MKHFARIATVAVFALFAASAFAKDTRVVGLVFDKGAETATIPDEIKGDEPVMYRFRAKRGQSLAVALKPLNRNTDFILCARFRRLGQPTLRGQGGQRWTACRAGVAQCRARPRRACQVRSRDYLEESRAVGGARSLPE